MASSYVRPRNFYPRPPRGGRPAPRYASNLFHVFLSTPSARRATLLGHPAGGRDGDFYPRPPRGGRPCNWWLRSVNATFLSTPSARRATIEGGNSIHFQFGFLSTPSARRATEGGNSIHFQFGFLSTPSARRATQRHRAADTAVTDFYPRPPRGGRPLIRELQYLSGVFLSTPSARRATTAWGAAELREWLFLSTPSARRATAKTETKSLFSYKLYNILHEFRRALIYNGSKNYPNHAK